MRAAVVGGGAYVAGRSMGRRAEQNQQAEGEQDQRISDLEQQQAPPAAQEQGPDAAATSPMIDQLNQLATLHQQGILTDDEFTAAKAKLFGT
jgi:hypothetical protein